MELLSSFMDLWERENPSATIASFIPLSICWSRSEMGLRVKSDSELAIGRSCRPSRARPDRDFMLPVGIGLGIIKRNPGPGRIGLSDLKCRSGSVQTKI